MSNHNNRFLKDPDETLDYSVDWSEWLAVGETIVTSTWTAPTGITKGSDTKTTTVCTVWLSGGTAGLVYTVANKISTTSGRIAERSLFIEVQQR